MARKKAEAAQANIPEGLPPAHAVSLAEEQLVKSMQDGYTDDRDLMNQLMGQIQMARAFSKFTDVVGFTKLQYIKENKLYRALAGVKGRDQDGNEITDVGTWDGFCRAIGSSQQKVDEDLLNIRTFGEEAMQQLSSVGAGYRDLRKLRALPADDRHHHHQEGEQQPYARQHFHVVSPLKLRLGVIVDGPDACLVMTSLCRLERLRHPVPRQARNSFLPVPRYRTWTWRPVIAACAAIASGAQSAVGRGSCSK